MSHPSIYTRRQFLRNGLLGAAFRWTLPAFLNATLQELAAAADGALRQTPTGRDAPILVVVQLAGGNDGLNTVVPYTDDFYYRARSRLALQKKACMVLTDTLGLHPSLTGLKALYDKGHLAIVQGVGYPNPNRSHFRSMEIWQTASDANRVESHGWIGRYFDNACSGMDASVGIAVGEQLPQAFAAPRPMGITFSNPRELARRPGASPEPMMEAFGDTSTANAGDSVERPGGAARSDLSPLDYVERVALDATVAGDEINRILTKPRVGSTYPASRLANDLSVVSQMIAGGMPTRVYYLSQGGYDTHANQLGSHANLLQQFGDALHAFVEDLAQQGNLDRVAVLCFSEFGRRVSENASGGTDHGAAAPVLLAGVASGQGCRGRRRRSILTTS